MTTKYVVTMTWDMQFTGFCTLEAFEDNRELYLDSGDTYEVFDGPDPDGTDEAFDEVKRLAKGHCVSEGDAIVPLSPQLEERMSKLTEGAEVNLEDPIKGDVDL